MEFTALLWTIGLFISSALICFGAALMSTEFKVARLCFWLTPIPLIISDIWWTMTTDQPLWARLGISGICGAVLLIGLGESLRWLGQKQANASQENEITGAGNAQKADANRPGENNGSAHNNGQIGVSGTVNGPVTNYFGGATPDKPRAEVRDPNSLYQFGVLVGSVQGPVVRPERSEVTFQFVRFSTPADPTSIIEYQNFAMICDFIKDDANAFRGTYIAIANGLKCKIIRERG